MVDSSDCGADFVNTSQGQTVVGLYIPFSTLQVDSLPPKTANCRETQPLRLLADCHRMGRLSSFRTVREIGSAIRINIDRIPH